MSDKTKIYAIVVTYNAMRNDWIFKCLESIQCSSLRPKIIVVDNNSSDQTLNFIEDNYADIICFKQSVNIGFGQANNIGIKYAYENGADYILLLNQDATLDKYALERMLSHSDGMSLLSPVHLNGNGTAVDTLFKYTIKSIEKIYDDILITGKLNASYYSGEVCAACWLMPRYLIETIGGFNPLFFHYSEDNNYYHRLIFHKVKTIIVTDAIMYHDRKIYGDINAFHKNKVKRDIVLLACNINLNFPKRLYNYAKTLFHYLFFDFPNGNYKIGTFTIEFFRLLFYYKSIRASRNKEKRLYHNWL